MLAGETDFLLKIVAPDWDSYQRFLSGCLTAAPNVAHVKSALVLRASKAAPGVPLDARGLANATDAFGISGESRDPSVRARAG
jgi:hypothetical protein